MSDIIFTPVVRTGEIPVSFFEAVIKNQAYEAVTLSWPEIVERLAAEAHQPKPTKESAHLLSPTIFSPAKRAKANVTIAGMIVIDVDHDGSVDGALSRLQDADIEAVLYTTANSRSGDERFRIIVPLQAPVDAETYSRAWDSLTQGLGVVADSTKRGAESMFYVPGQYKCAGENRFEHVVGEIRSASEWIEQFPPAIKAVTSEVPVAPPPGLAPVERLDGLYDSDFVKAEWIAEYLRLGRGEHHKGLYAFMVRVAMSAIARGRSIDASQLADLARDLDAADGGWYGNGRGQTRRNIDEEANRALQWAWVHATPVKARVTIPTDTKPSVAAKGEWPDEAEDVDNRADPPTDGELESLPPMPAPERFPRKSTEPFRTSFEDVHPPLACWVDASLIKPYNFEDQGFITGAGGITVCPEFRYLVERCVGVSNGYLVRSAHDWVLHTKKNTASAALFNEYGGKRGDSVVTKQTIKEFLSDSGGVVMFQGECLAPGMPSFVIFQGRRYLNRYRDTRLTGSIDDIPDAEIICRIIHENLCDLPRASLKEMVEQAQGSARTLFRWVIHWLASAYCRPGHHIGTVLWFVGANMGVGKATLVSVMKTLVGQEWCKKASSTEIERGWNTFIADALLIEADEFENGSRQELNRVFKAWIANPLISVSKRQYGAFDIPNVVNWIATTNNLNPIVVEPKERRHTFVKTTDDPTRNVLADAYWALEPARRDRAIRGFAAILASIDIDADFIRKPFKTPFKEGLIEQNISPVERWFAETDRERVIKKAPPLANETMPAWLVNHDRQARDAWEDYLAWMKQHDPNAGVRTETAWGTKMAELEARGFVKKHKTGCVFYRKLRKYYEGTNDASTPLDQLLGVVEASIRGEIDNG